VVEISHKTVSQLTEELRQIPFFEDLDAGNLISRIPFFDGVPEKLVQKIADQAEILSFPEAQLICHQGEYEEVFYLILSGKVEVSIRTQSQPKIVLGELGRDDFFGEMGPLSGQPRTATVTSLVRTILLGIPKEIFLHLYRESPRLKDMIDQKYIQRSLHTHLRQVGIFSRLSDAEISDLASRVKLMSFTKDRIIIREGDEGDSLYLVRAGFVKVSHIRDGKEKILTYLREGSYFGEAALIRGEKRNATVTAISNVESVRIDKQDFQHILDANPFISEEFEKTVEQRAQDTEQIERDQQKAEAMEFVVKHGLAQAREILVIDLNRCIACNRCMEVCEKVRGHSRISRKGQRLGQLLIPTSCIHCENPECLLCPFGGIVRDRHGEVQFTESCIGCGGCAKRCPYGNILIVNVPDESGELPDRKIPIKCDMCIDQENVACVYNCPVGAAKLLRPEELIAEHEAAKLGQEKDSKPDQPEEAGGEAT
jgi:CRP-like cAMP-binding protein